MGGDGVREEGLEAIERDGETGRVAVEAVAGRHRDEPSAVCFLADAAREPEVVERCVEAHAVGGGVLGALLPHQSVEGVAPASRARRVAAREGSSVRTDATAPPAGYRCRESARGARGNPGGLRHARIAAKPARPEVRDAGPWSSQHERDDILANSIRHSSSDDRRSRRRALCGFGLAPHRRLVVRPFFRSRSNGVRLSSSRLRAIRYQHTQLIHPPHVSEYPRHTARNSSR